ncbi:MAG: hypothetical protein J1E60_02780 [Christensenellaceae bacterium]|nr:hypothetical protein [Christensenellaceae bacterium]
MISFDDIEKLFARSLENKFCIEIEFCVAGLSDFQSCWMGKMPDKSKEGKELFWFGLAADGSKAYNYNNFFDFSNALVFDGKSLKEVWDSVELLSVDGLEPETRIKDLLY